MKSLTSTIVPAGGHEIAGQCKHRALTQDAREYFPGKPTPRRPTFIEIPVGEMLLERFTVRGCAGEDALGRVYLLEDTIGGEKVTARLHAGIEEQVPDWFLKTNRLRTQIRDHRQIIRPLELHHGRWGGGSISILTLEFANGGTLSEWMREGHRDTPNRAWEVARYVQQACQGLEALDKAGLVHLAVTPEHLLIASENLKIGGLEYCDDKNAVPTNLHEKVQSIAVYLAPERFNSPGHCDVRSTIYSLGVILFELMHPQWQAPFQGPPDRLAMLHQEAPPPQLPGIPENIQAVVYRCLEKDPGCRYSDYQSVSHALGACFAQQKSCPGSSDGAVPERNSPTPDVDAWEIATERMEHGDLEGAVRACQNVLIQSPEHVGARSLLNTLESRESEARRIYSAISSGDAHISLEEQANLLVHAESLYQGHYSRSAAQHAFTKRCERFRDLAQATEDALRRGERDLALSLLERAASLNPDSAIVSGLQHRIREELAHMQKLYEQMYEAFRRGDKQIALRLAAQLDVLAGTQGQRQPGSVHEE